MIQPLQRFAHRDQQRERALTASRRQPRVYAWVFTNARTEQPFTVNGVRHTFDRAVARAGIAGDDVTLHTLRHTALSRMIASGYDDYTVMEISGHSSTRMHARYTHPTEQRKIGALDLPVVTKRSQSENDDETTAREIAELLGKQWWTAGGSNS